MKGVFGQGKVAQSSPPGAMQPSEQPPEPEPVPPTRAAKSSAPPKGSFLPKSDAVDDLFSGDKAAPQPAVRTEESTLAVLGSWASVKPKGDAAPAPLGQEHAEKGASRSGVAGAFSLSSLRGEGKKRNPLAATMMGVTPPPAMSAAPPAVSHVPAAPPPAAGKVPAALGKAEDEAGVTPVTDVLERPAAHAAETAAEAADPSFGDLDAALPPLDEEQTDPGDAPSAELVAAEKEPAYPEEEVTATAAPTYPNSEGNLSRVLAQGGDDLFSEEGPLLAPPPPVELSSEPPELLELESDAPPPEPPGVPGGAPCWATVSARPGGAGGSGGGASDSSSSSSGGSEESSTGGGGARSGPSSENKSSPPEPPAPPGPADTVAQHGAPPGTPDAPSKLHDTLVGGGPRPQELEELFAAAGLKPAEPEPAAAAGKPAKAAKPAQPITRGEPPVTSAEPPRRRLSFTQRALLLGSLAGLLGGGLIALLRHQQAAAPAVDMQMVEAVDAPAPDAPAGAAPAEQAPAVAPPVPTASEAAPQPKTAPSAAAKQGPEAKPETDVPAEAPAPEKPAATPTEEPLLPDSMSHGALIRRAEREAERGDAKRAEAMLRALLDREPRDHHVMEPLVRLLLRQGRGREAVPLAEKMVQRRSRRASYRELLGDARRLAGDSEGAKAAYRKALEIDPSNTRVRQRVEP